MYPFHWVYSDTFIRKSGPKELCYKDFKRQCKTCLLSVRFNCQWWGFINCFCSELFIAAYQCKYSRIVIRICKLSEDGEQAFTIGYTFSGQKCLLNGNSWTDRHLQCKFLLQKCTKHDEKKKNGIRHQVFLISNWAKQMAKK